MREILFRGKRICEKKNWAEGCLLNLDADSGHVFIVPFFRGASTMPVSRIVECTSNYVDPETVGQFTGLTDKHGKKVFEGDVIRYITPDNTKATGVVRFGTYGTGGTLGVGFYVAWVARDGAGWLRQDIGFWAKYRDIEIIGNIHDNPELLEVSHA